jgi:hypothetical protein
MRSQGGTGFSTTYGRGVGCWGDEYCENVRPCLWGRRNELAVVADMQYLTAVLVEVSLNTDQAVNLRRNARFAKLLANSATRESQPFMLRHSRRSVKLIRVVSRRVSRLLRVADLRLSQACWVVIDVNEFVETTSMRDSM